MLNRPNLNNIICEKIRDKILLGELKQGEKIPETELAKEMGVSITPIRLSLVELTKEGLVESIPRRGSFVKTLNIKDLIDILEIRAVLEGLAGRLAALNIRKEQIDILKEIIKEEKQIAMEIINYAEHQNNTEKYRNLCSKETEKDIQFHTAVVESTDNIHLVKASKMFLSLTFFVFLEPDPIFYRREIIVKEHSDMLDAIEKGDSELAAKLSSKHVNDAKIIFSEKLNEKNEG